MGKISSEMTSLCQNIIGAYGARKKILEELKKESENIRNNAREFINDCEKLREETTKVLMKTLKDDRETLIKIVDSLREDFQKKEKEIRANLKEASKTWRMMEDTLKGKKKK